MGDQWLVDEASAHDVVVLQSLFHELAGLGQDPSLECFGDTSCEPRFQGRGVIPAKSYSADTLTEVSQLAHCGAGQAEGGAFDDRCESLLLKTFDFTEHLLEPVADVRFVSVGRQDVVKVRGCVAPVGTVGLPGADWVAAKEVEFICVDHCAADVLSQFKGVLSFPSRGWAEQDHRVFHQSPLCCAVLD